MSSKLCYVAGSCCFTGQPTLWPNPTVIRRNFDVEEARSRWEGMTPTNSGHRPSRFPHSTTVMQPDYRRHIIYADVRLLQINERP